MRVGIPARLVVLVALMAVVARARADGPVEDEVGPFLATHCVKCHSAEKRKGGVDLSKGSELASIRRDRKPWRKVVAQVEALEMPPSGEPEPGPEDRDRFLGLIRTAIASAACDDPKAIDPGPTPPRRLTRDEYDRTVRDLLGVEVRSAEAVGMPSDGSGHGPGFANGAEGLILPPVLMEKYFASADKALALVFDRPENAKARAAFLVASPGDDLSAREAARRVIARFARLAYRRPVSVEEIERFLALFDRSMATGATFEGSARLMAKAALVSPHFLFRVERDRSGLAPGSSHRVGDHELAVWLSYFLWSRMPDAILSDLADRGALSDPSTFEAQARRMLADPRSRALADNFAEQWLQIGRLDEARPSLESFPIFTSRLRRAFRDETATFFDQLRQEDRAVFDLLDANYAYLNADLARHYDIPGIEGTRLC